MMPDTFMNPTDLNWVIDEDFSDEARPIRSFTAIVGGDVATGRVDFFTRWEPNCYCSYHRHLANTMSWVVAGELEVEDPDGTKKIRPLGHYNLTPAGRLHWERAGPEGCTIFFSLLSQDGRAFEVPGLNGEAPTIVSVDDMLKGDLPLAIA